VPVPKENMLPKHEKLLETVVKIQLEEHFETNNLFNDEQSGFRKNHSCETALDLIIANWTMDSEQKNSIVDFKRTFETIIREILIKKFEIFGVKGKELQWLQSGINRQK
jgi:hypothetical protein